MTTRPENCALRAVRQGPPWPNRVLPSSLATVTGALGTHDEDHHTPRGDGRKAAATGPPGTPEGDILSPLLDKRTLMTTLNKAKG